MKGIKDTRIVQNTMGKRLREARGKRKRPALVRLLKENPKAPIESRAEMTVERLKQWEYGNNPIAHEWIPAICEVLNCDVGYLFGEYEEERREFSDAHETTGLSKDSIKILAGGMHSSGCEDLPIQIPDPNKIRIGILDLLINSDFFILLLSDIYECYERYRDYRHAANKYKLLRQSTLMIDRPRTKEEWDKKVEIGDAFYLMKDKKEKYEVAVFKANNQFGRILNNIIEAQYKKNTGDEV